MLVRVIFILFTILFIVSCSDDNGTDPTPFDYNQLFDGTFDRNLMNSGWHEAYLQSFKQYVVFERDTEIMESGKASGSIEILPTHPADTSIFYYYSKLFTKFKTGVTYEISGWIKYKNMNSTPYIFVNCWDIDYNNIDIEYLDITSFSPGSKDWYNVKFQFTPPKTTSDITVRAGFPSPGNIGGKVWFDEITIKEL